MEGYIGSIMMFAGNFDPKNWASCEGQLLAISENTALFSLLGTTYGGNGRSTFALPDLRGRVPVGIGAGPGLSPMGMGYKIGTETTQMTIAQMPTHSHTANFTGSGGGSGSLTASAKMYVAGSAGDVSDPSNTYIADGKAGFTPADIYNATKGTDTLATDAIEVTLSGSAGGITGGTVNVEQTGGGQPSNNRQPSLGMRYIICTDGLFPSRN